MYDVVVVCTLHLTMESFDTSKIPYDFWNIMFHYSPFCLQRLHQFVCTTSWVVIVVLLTNVLPKCVAFLAISYVWTLQDVEKWAKKKTFLLEEKKIFPFYLLVEISNVHVVIVSWCIGSYNDDFHFSQFCVVTWVAIIFNQIWNIQNTKVKNLIHHFIF